MLQPVSAYISLLFLLLSSCRGEFSESQTKSIANPFAVHSDKVLKVCWISEGGEYDYWLKKAREIVASEWQEKTVVSFEGWQACGKDGDEAEIRIKFIDDYRPASCVGEQRCSLKEKYKATMVLSPTYYSRFLSCHPGWFFIDSWGRESCYRHQVLHEFGHALGLLHEQERYDSSCTYPGSNMEPYSVEPMGPYDAKSIMNYCYSARNITSLDASAVNTLYLRDSFVYWGQIRSADGRCIAAHLGIKTGPRLAMESCKETRSQLWGLHKKGKLVSFALASDGSLHSKKIDSWCLGSSSDKLGTKQQSKADLVSCDEASQAWSYIHQSGQLRMGYDIDESAFLGLSVDEQSLVLFASLLDGPKSENENFEKIPPSSWSWQGMTKSIGTNFILYPSQGGSGGKSFDDRPMLDLNDLPSKLLIRAGNRIDAIGILYQSGKKIYHGGVGGKVYELHLQPGEMINWLQLAVARVGKTDRVVGLRATTTEGQQLALGSFPALANYFSYTMRKGQGVMGFYGRSGKEVDQLGVYATP